MRFGKVILWRDNTTLSNILDDLIRLVESVFCFCYSLSKLYSHFISLVIHLECRLVFAVEGVRVIEMGSSQGGTENKASQ